MNKQTYSLEYKKRILDIVWLELARKDSSDFREWLSKTLNLDIKKINHLYQFILGEKLLSESNRWDIQAYLVKQIKENEDVINLMLEHEYSQNKHYSYDPAKNGQNILKHGLSFNEVFQYASHFGCFQYLKSCAKDGFRVIVFSDLEKLNNKNLLCFPNPRVSRDSYILSVVAYDVQERYRFISSRQLSSKPDKYREDIKNSLRECGETEENLEESTNSCVAFLEQNVFIFKKE